MDSEEPPNVRVACSGDIDEVVRLMHDAAAWMSIQAKFHLCCEEGSSKKKENKAR